MSLNVEHGLERLDRGRPDLRAGDEPRPDGAPRGARRPSPAPTTAAPASSASAPVRSCSGEAGLLDGRVCTTHWLYVDELEERFPDADRQVRRPLHRRGSDHHVGRVGGRTRCLPAHHPQRVRRVGRVHVRAPDGGGAASRRRSGSVHRDAGAGLHGRHPAAVARVDVGQPRTRTSASRCSPARR